MKKNIIPGLLFVAMIPASFWIVFFSDRDLFIKITLIVCWAWLTQMFLFNKKAKKIRKERYGTSNIFVALFKEGKNENENRG